MDKIKKMLTKYPRVRLLIKKVYYLIGYLQTKKDKCFGQLELMSDPKTENLVGYYDKCPWNSDESKFLYSSVANANKYCAAKTKCKIIIRNTHDGEVEELAETNCWNSQQGCMLQWLGPNFDRKVIYNDYEDGEYCSFIVDIETREKTKICMPVYDVSKNGDFALTLDFSWLHKYRPGYGYINKVNERTENDFDLPCIWKIDIPNNSSKPLLTYRQLVEFMPKETMRGAIHKVNHIMISPNGKHFMFLHRWILDNVKYDRLLVCDMDGLSMINLLDEDMVSHSFWLNDKEIITFAKTYDKGNAYYILNIVNKKCDIVDYMPKVDGHPSLSPNGKFIITDSYPTFNRTQSVFLVSIEEKQTKEIARVSSSPKYIEDCRCDLHPRWNRSSNKICIDAAIGKYRNVYQITNI